MTEMVEKTENTRKKGLTSLKRSLIWNSWVQLFLVLGIVILVNVWSSKHFLRLDISKDKSYSLDIATRGLVWKLDKPLLVKVYFSENLQAPYNNHKAELVDKLEELRAYSKGWMQIDVIDPTNRSEKEAEAERFGINAIEYRFKDRNITELKKVYMGAALVYGDRQETLPAITQIETLEYDIAQALRKLLSEDENKRTIGYTVGHEEPNLMTAGGPMISLRERLLEAYMLEPVTLGGSGGVPENIDVLWIVGPQTAFSDRELYQVDQFLMKGGSVGIFATNTKADMRTLSPQNLYHNLEAFLGHYGVKLNRDILVDRVNNGRMSFPVRYGNKVRTVQINYPLIPKLTELNKTVPVLNGIDSMLSPFSSTLEVVDTGSPSVQGELWVESSEKAGKIRGIVTLDPNAYQMVAPGEETGTWGLVAGLTGAWTSFFRGKELPKPDDGSELGVYEETERLREGASARLVVAGSADMVANNVAFMLNLADWMVQDEELIRIRSKVIRYNDFPAVEEGELVKLRILNGLGGIAVLFILAGLRIFLRKRKH